MGDKALRNIYKYLPMVFGCHCRDDRSFHYKGVRFPICARCTGELVGAIIGIFFSFIYVPEWWVCIIIAIPMIVDGSVQYVTNYESNNIKRFITGFLFGYAFISLIVIGRIITGKHGLRISQLIGRMLK